MTHRLGARGLLVAALILAPGCSRDGTGDPPTTCAEANCSANAFCDDSRGDAVCVCWTGYSDVAGDGSRCEDIDECAEGTAACDPAATCVNTPGFFECTCPTDWLDPNGDGSFCLATCTADPTLCGANATCNNDPVDPQCACDPGFSGNGLSCTDDDECTDGSANCDPLAACDNLPGSFTCTCPTGYDDVNGDGTACNEIDECTDGTSNCDPVATCTNDPPGSFTCACPISGYDDVNGDGTQCDDIDECSTGAANCDPTATCANAPPGSFTCTCPPQTMDVNGDGTLCVQSCLVNPGVCDPNASCNNDPVDPQCICDPGYVGDGLTCTASQPCLEHEEDVNGDGSLCLALFTVSAQDDLLRIVAVEDGVTFQAMDVVDTRAIVVTGLGTPQGLNGLATHPGTGDLFAAARFIGGSGRELVILDQNTAVGTSVGNTGVRFAGLAFDDTGTLWGISGDGDPANPSTLFTIDPATGLATVILALGNGDDGEALGFSPATGLLYHGSGLGNPILESIDPVTLAVASLVVGPPYTDDETMAFVWWPRMGEFLFKQGWEGDNVLRLTTGGTATVHGTTLGYQAKGLAFADPPNPPW